MKNNVAVYKINKEKSKCIFYMPAKTLINNLKV